MPCSATSAPIAWPSAESGTTARLRASGTSALSQMSESTSAADTSSVSRLPMA